MRASGSLQWIYHSSDDEAESGEILTAYHPDYQTEPKIVRFKESLRMQPSQEHGYGALEITDFAGKWLKGKLVEQSSGHRCVLAYTCSLS